MPCWKSSGSKYHVFSPAHPQCPWPGRSPWAPTCQIMLSQWYHRSGQVTNSTKESGKQHGQWTFTVEPLAYPGQPGTSTSPWLIFASNRKKSPIFWIAIPTFDWSLQLTPEGLQKCFSTPYVWNASDHFQPLRRNNRVSFIIWKSPNKVEQEWQSGSG